MHDSIGLFVVLFPDRARHGNRLAQFVKIGAQVTQKSLRKASADSATPRLRRPSGASETPAGAPAYGPAVLPDRAPETRVGDRRSQRESTAGGNVKMHPATG
jgi:hypothetical protein